jgi:RHS repeat-associated protein
VSRACRVSLRPHAKVCAARPANSNRLTSIAITATDTDKDGPFETSEQRKNQAQQLSIAANSNRLLGFTQTLTTLTGTKTNSTVNSQVNYTLDANGNLTSDGLRSFQYDGQDRLSKVILGSTFVGTDTIAGNELAAHTYLHNAAGQRVFKSEPKTELTAPSETTLGTGFVSWLQTNFSWLWATAQTNATLGDSYLYADGNLPSWALLGQYGNGGASSTGRTEYLWLPTQDGSAIPIGLYRSGKLHAIHTDHLGTPRLITNETNTAQWQWPYSAFGDNAPTGILKPTTNAGSAFTSIPATQGSGTTTATLLAVSSPTQLNNLRFPGQYFDSESGHFYNTFRTYCPTCGRYTQADPMGLAAGWNQFIYADANPFSIFDPYGLEGIDITGDMSGLDPLSQAQEWQDYVTNRQRQKNAETALVATGAGLVAAGTAGAICTVPAYKLGLAVLTAANMASKMGNKLPKMPPAHPQTMTQTTRRLKEIQEASRNAQPQRRSGGM